MTMRKDGLTNNGTSPFSLEARDEDYDTYLFWPSLSNGVESSKESFGVTHQRVIVLTFMSYITHRCVSSLTPSCLTTTIIVQVGTLRLR